MMNSAGVRWRGSVAKKASKTPKGVAHPSPAPPATVPTTLGRPAGPKRWLYRLAAGTLVPAVLFALLEVSLRLFGYGYPTSFFLWSAQTADGGGYVSNYDFSRRFFPPGLER